MIFDRFTKRMDWIVSYYVCLCAVATTKFRKAKSESKAYAPVRKMVSQRRTQKRMTNLFAQTIGNGSRDPKLVPDGNIGDAKG